MDHLLETRSSPEADIGLVRREFLGWDAPLPPRAAAALADCYAAEGELRMTTATVAVPGARAGRRLKELLVCEAERRSLRLVPPRVITIGRLPELLYEPPLPPATGALARRVWVAALRSLPAEQLSLLFPHAPDADDLLGWTRLSRTLESLHREVAGAGLLFHQVPQGEPEGLLFDDVDRWKTLARLQGELVLRLHELGYGEQGIQRMDALAGGAVALEGDLWLCGVAEMPLVVQRMVEALASSGGSVTSLVHAPEEAAAGFDLLGAVLPPAWTERPVPLREDQLVVVDRPADQADAVVRGLAGLGGRHSADEIVIAAPDAELRPYIVQRLAEAGVPVHVGEGEPVERSAPARLLAAFAEFIDGRGFAACAELARHPDLWLWLDRGRASPAAAGFREPSGWIEALDERFSARLPSRLLRRGPGTVPKDAVATLCVALDDERLLGRLRGKRTLSGWMSEILALIVEVYASGELDRWNPEHRRLLEVSQALKGAAMDLHALPPRADEECDGATAIRILLEEVAEQMIAPEADEVAVELLGWLELHLDDAPVAVVTGFNEQFLPESTSAHPFLPNSLRSRLGILDNERRYARDAYQLTALLHCRQSVLLIAGRRTAQGDPLRPSRLMFAVEGQPLAERVRRFYDEDPVSSHIPAARHATAGASPSRFELPPEPTLRAPEPIAHLSVSQFRQLLADPYVFALQKLRKLEPLDDSARELDGLAFGTIAHDVLESFGRSDVVATTDSDVIARRLDALIDREFAARYGRDALPAARLQMEQLRVRLHAFARWQARWAAAGWRIAGVECRTPPEGVEFEVDGQPFAISGRIDRIDHHPEHGWALLDYKTGDSGDGPEETHRKGPAGEKQWVDLQLPLYRHILPHVRDAAGEAPVPTSDGAPVRLGYVLLPRDAENVRECLAEWDDDVLESADEQARAVVRFLRRNVFHFDPELVTERSAGSLAGLLGIGYLAGAGEGDGGEATE